MRDEDVIRLGTQMAQLTRDSLDSNDRRALHVSVKVGGENPRYSVSIATGGYFLAIGNDDTMTKAFARCAEAALQYMRTRVMLGLAAPERVAALETFIGLNLGC